jgi:fatty acid desaturase
MLWCRFTFLYWSEVGDHYNTDTGMRSTLGKGYNRLFHNNGYHAVHHEFPTIPFYRLRDACDRQDFIKTDKSKSLWNTFEQIREPLPLPAEGEDGLAYENYRLGRREFRDKAQQSE